jgi:hypothetical protein
MRSTALADNNVSSDVGRERRLLFLPTFVS